MVDVYLLLIIYILKVTEIIIMYNYSKIVQQSIDIFCDREWWFFYYKNPCTIIVLAQGKVDIKEKRIIIF